MKRVLAWVILAGAIASLGLAGYLTYQLLYPSKQVSPVDDSGVVSEPPEEPDVDVPSRVKERVLQDRQKRDRLFQQAKADHRAGRLNEAVTKYREVISLSGPDETATETYRLLGDIYASRQQYGQAVLFYEHGISIQPKNARLHFRKGKTHQETGDLDQAQSALQEAWNLEKNVEHALALGNVQMERSNYQQAEETFQAGLEVDDTDSRLWVNLALARQHQGNDDGALEALAEINPAQLDSKTASRAFARRAQIHFERGNYSEARDFWQDARQYASDNPDLIYNIAMTFLREDRFSSAVQYLRLYLGERPEDRDALVDMAYAQFHLGQRDSALEYYNRAHEVSEDGGGSELLALAELHQQTGNFDQAKNRYREIINSDPDEETYEKAFRSLGQLYLITEQPEASASAYRNAIQLAPEDPDLRYNLAVVYDRLGQEEDAIEQLRRAVSISPDEPAYRFLLGQLELEQDRQLNAMEQFNYLANNYRDHYDARYMVHYINYLWGLADEARQGWRELLEDVGDPEIRARIYQGIGNTYFEQEQYRAAGQAYQDGLDEVEKADLIYNLGLTYLNLNQIEQATSSFREAREIGGDDPGVLNVLGVSLFERGLYQEAEEVLQRAQELAPEDPRIVRNLNAVREYREEAA